MEAINIFVPLLSSLGYSLIWFLKSVIDPENPTKLKNFEIPKLLATLVVGAFIGVLGIISGVEVNQIGIEASLLAYAFVIAGVEQMGTAIYNYSKIKMEE